MRIVTVVQGGHGPVPMVENTRRYIDAEPTEIDADNAYYARRMMSGELVEYVEPVPAEFKQEPVVETPMVMVASMPIPGAATLTVSPPMPPPAEKKEEER